MNCTLEFHSCITCCGVRFTDWLSSDAVGGEFSVSMLLDYGQEKYNHYKDDFSLLPLELCSYCQKSIALGVNANPSLAGVRWVLLLRVFLLTVQVLCQPVRRIIRIKLFVEDSYDNVPWPEE